MDTLERAVKTYKTLHWYIGESDKANWKLTEMEHRSGLAFDEPEQYRKRIEVMNRYDSLDPQSIHIRSTDSNRLKEMLLAARKIVESNNLVKSLQVKVSEFEGSLSTEQMREYARLTSIEPPYAVERPSNHIDEI